MIVESYRTIRLGVKSLLLHKLRSALTTLGILIGVAAVVAMLAIGEGASYEAQQQIKAMGSTNILIQSKKPPAEEADSQGRHFAPDFYGLTVGEARRTAQASAVRLEILGEGRAVTQEPEPGPVIGGGAQVRVQFRRDGGEG